MAHKRTFSIVLVALVAVGVSWSASADAAVYWTSGAYLGRANNDGSNQDQTFIGEVGIDFLRGACGFAVDASHIYWAEQGRNQIGRADLDGNNPVYSFITGANEPCGVAVDAEHIYWANRGGNSIGRARLDGSEVDQNFIGVIELPCGVAVNGSSIFWATPTEDAVGRASLAGGNID